MYVRILLPRNQDGAPVTSGPISTRALQSWLGPAYRDAAGAAQTIADTAARHRQGAADHLAAGRPGPRRRARMLLGQWRHTPASRSAPANWPGCVSRTNSRVGGPSAAQGRW